MTTYTEEELNALLDLSKRQLTWAFQEAKKVIKGLRTDNDNLRARIIASENMMKAHRLELHLLTVNYITDSCSKAQQSLDTNERLRIKHQQEYEIAFGAI